MISSPEVLDKGAWGSMVQRPLSNESEKIRFRVTKITNTSLFSIGRNKDAQLRG